MKTITKAALAGGVGAALLLGGAGTIAYWSDTQAGPEANIQSGVLDIGEITAANENWSIRQAAAGEDGMPAGTAEAAAVPYTEGMEIVPGDVLTYTANVPVTLSGENMAARLEVAQPAATGATGPSADLAAALRVAVTSVNADPANTESVILQPADITGGTVPVQVSVTFPWGTDAQQIAQAGDVTFSTGYTLTQVPETTATVP